MGINCSRIGSRFTFDVKKEFFPERELRPWHRVPREAAAVPGSLAVSEARLEQPGVVEGALPLAGVG